MEIQIIHNKIHEIRGQKVILDFDLAELYKVPTKSLNQAVKRNIERFSQRHLKAEPPLTKSNLIFNPFKITCYGK